VQLDRREPYLVECGAIGAQRIREVRRLTQGARFGDVFGPGVHAPLSPGQH
jgi:hypothetical protein